METTLWNYFVYTMINVSFWVIIIVSIGFVFLLVIRYLLVEEEEEEEEIERGM